MISQTSTAFGLYIHWPFCQSKCPYCDFNSHVRATIDEDLWQKALLQELKYVADQTGDRTLTSVFFGGGTPSLMSASTVGALIDALSLYWTVDSNVEITLEANPNSVEAKKFQSFRSAGINRVSLGIQALNDPALKFLGRKHSALEACRAIDIARYTFERFSFDLIYARPEQTLCEWRQELSHALTLAGDHLSLYQLTIEPGTAFYTAHQRQDWHIPDEDLASSLYEMTQEIMEQHGLPAYEVSNHARIHQPCQHNMVYWRYQDYACIGPGAHGRLTLNSKKFAIKNYRAPETWLNAVERNGHGQQENIPLSPSEYLTECLMMGLRLTEGVSIQRLQDLTGQSFDQILPKAKTGALRDEGYLYPVDTHLKLTPAGRQRLNAVLKFLNVDG